MASPVPSKQQVSSTKSPMGGAGTSTTDYPRRPPSAYNLFFRQEREKVKREIESGCPPADFLQNYKVALGRLQGKTKPAQFQATTSTVARRWKELSIDERLKYEQMARAEMLVYKERKIESQEKLMLECKEAVAAAAAQQTTTSSTLPSKEQDVAPDLKSALPTTFQGISTSAPKPVSPMAFHSPERLGIYPSALSTSKPRLVLPRLPASGNEDLGALLRTTIEQERKSILLKLWVEEERKKARSSVIQEMLLRMQTPLAVYSPLDSLQEAKWTAASSRLNSGFHAGNFVNLWGKVSSNGMI